ncbi:MAG: FeoA family protein [Planctomycetota bacterium]|jgi:Fe2+ transport system protein FeoA
MSIALDQLPPGSSARVLRIEGEDGLSRRLSEIGFWPETDVTVVRRAPFGDPTLYHLRGFQLALRSNEAARIIVQAPESVG